MIAHCVSAPLRPMIAVALLAGCAAQEPAPPSAGRVSALPAIVSPADNPTTPDKIALGKQLFVDTRLSGTGKMSCQSCHYRHLGWTDAQVLSRKDDGLLNTRHTPSLYNVGYQTEWYWDGRAKTLEGQILAAWRAQIGGDPAKVVAVLNQLPGYANQFQKIFNEPATPDNVAKALGAYLRAKVSDDSPWDRYERGDTRAVSREAVEGFGLFMGKGRCGVCHTPPYFGNSTYYNVGLEHGKPKPDTGRFAVSKNEADRSAFKTPSLRSVAASAPYFHDGSSATLEQAVRYMASGGPAGAAKSELFQPTGLSDAEITKVIAFLRALTSEEAWTAPRIP